ncbi:NAD(P)-dependent oxidoreductase [Lachnospiraceae bacterium KK002]|uniref:NAD-dependent epimerase/dehydratase family protein n=1 Tax=Eubacterium sp. 14-2 TaxID=1235790 RepID=UPI00033805C7|nr:NAD(P)-dependent oxidoreductase [Eubacterium sp. 14-2]EOT23605.1 hypothetical protein C805_03270 [Eubacterium sp. 14-2]
MKRVAVTGATGAIGMALIQKCITEQVEVWVFCRKDSERINCIPRHPLVHLTECSLDGIKELSAEKIPGCEVFYHFAWASTIGAGRNDVYLQLKNVEYTLDAVHLAKRIGCETFIGAGSQAEYGRHENLLTPDTPAFPENGYGMAKLCAGQMSRLECKKLGMRHIWTRILSVYGPYDGQATMISMLIRKLLNEERPLLTKGEQQWDYLYSQDAAEALFSLGLKGKEDKVYCVGSGKTAPLCEYMEKVRRAVNPAAELGIGEVPYTPNQVMFLGADISELIRDTGFQPDTEFDEGIRKTVQWFRKQEGL